MFAVARLTPSPPARVDSKNRNSLKSKKRKSFTLFPGCGLTTSRNEEEKRRDQSFGGAGLLLGWGKTATSTCKHWLVREDAKAAVAAVNGKELEGKALRVEVRG